MVNGQSNTLFKFSYYYLFFKSLNSNESLGVLNVILRNNCRNHDGKLWKRLENLVVVLKLYLYRTVLLVPSIGYRTFCV